EVEAIALRNAILRRFIESDAGVGIPEVEGAPPRSPIVIVLDDLHFAQEASLGLLGYLIEHLRAPVLLICLGRPELLARKGWLELGRKGDRHVKREISPLSEEEANVVMRELLAPCEEQESAQDLMDAACTLAGGNPGYLEQMLRIFFELGVLEVVRSEETFQEDTWRIHPDKLSAVRLPMTVSEAVSARIAALAPKERDLLERAAMMGGVFWLGGVLSTLRADAKTPEVWEADRDAQYIWARTTLNELTERDYILHLPDSSFAGDEEYAFKHNLERETLVRYLSPTLQARYHAKVADWLSYKESVRSNEEFLSMLAHHREEANERSLAVLAYLGAADLARARYVFSSAVGHYESAFRLIQEGAEIDPDRIMEALHHYGDVLQATGRNQDALDVFYKMLGFAFRTEQRAKGGSAHGRIGRVFRDTGRLEEALTHFETALRLFTSVADQRGIASTTDDLGKVHWIKGDYAKALECTSRALTMRKKLGDKRSISLSLNNLALVYQDSGQYKLALEALESALAIRRETNDMVGVIATLNNLGTVAQDQREDQKALTLFAEALQLAKDLGDRGRMAMILTNMGESRTRLNQTQAAITDLQQSLAITEELGDRFGHAEALRAMGKAYVGMGDVMRGRDSVERAIKTFRTIGSRVHVGVSLRALGEVLASFPDREMATTALTHIEEARVIFEEIGNELELARTYRALAETLRNISRLQGSTAQLQEAAKAAELADKVFAKIRASITS
ncbi:MAG: tetratricopeptide repeat protein, partial [Polyangiaceae bacterium]|nr:tetratricopeptide repeat protein [Polyangiaceae bacterium]